MVEPLFSTRDISRLTGGPMNGGVFFVVQGIDICTFTDEKLDNEAVARDDSQVEWSVTFLVDLIEEPRICGDDLFNAIQILVFGTEMYG